MYVLLYGGRYSDSLRTGRSGDRIPVGGGARFSAPVQTGPRAQPASYTMGTGSFPGVKRPGRGVDHPPPSNTEVEGRVELYICSPSGPSWPVIGWTLPLKLYITCWSRWPCGLRLRSEAVRLLWSWVRIPLLTRMFVCYVWCVFCR